MKSKIRKALGLVIISTLVSGAVLASGYSQTIEVVMNSIRVKVNGEYMSGDNLVYKGTTYVPLRAAAEILDKDIVWDGQTKTVSINDKPLDSKKNDFKVPQGVPDEAILVETIAEYKYHKFNYLVDLPSGSRISQVEISHAPGERPHILLAGYDKEDIPFINYTYNDEPTLSGLVSSYTNHMWPASFTDDDYNVVYREIDRFFKAYGYEYDVYDEWVKYNGHRFPRY